MDATFFAEVALFKNTPGQSATGIVRIYPDHAGLYRIS
jgi:hypothetical protein